MQYFYGVTALKNLAFTLEKGEKIAVLSNTEGGKTSLLKCIAGLYPATSGKIFINEKDITRSKPKERDVLFIYEDGGILKRHTVKFNLEYSLKVRKVAKAERKKRISMVAKKYKLEPILTDRGAILYEDDIVKIAFARAELRKSAVVLIDDIFKMLPFNLREKIFEEMCLTIKSLDSAVIFATNSVDDAFTVCDKAIILTYGEVEQIDTRAQLFDNPASLNVDKIINPYKNRLLINVEKDDVGTYVVLLGKKNYINVSDNYVAQDVFASFELQESTGGTMLFSDSKVYRKGQLFVNFAENLTLKVENNIYKNSYGVAVRSESLKIFDSTTEKLLTYLTNHGKMGV